MFPHLVETFIRKGGNLMAEFKMSDSEDKNIWNLCTEGFQTLVCLKHVSWSCWFVLILDAFLKGDFREIALVNFHFWFRCYIVIPGMQNLFFQIKNR